jgi:hypothetical protein
MGDQPETLIDRNRALQRRAGAAKAYTWLLFADAGEAILRAHAAQLRAQVLLGSGLRSRSTRAISPAELAYKVAKIASDVGDPGTALRLLNVVDRLLTEAGLPGPRDGRREAPH